MDRERAMFSPRMVQRRSGSGRQLTIAISPRTLWTAAGIVLFFAVLWLVVAKGLHVLLLLYIGIVLAEGIRPLVNWLHERHIPRPLAVVATYLAGLLVVAGIGWLLLQPFLDQIAGLTASLPHFVSQLQSLLARIEDRVGSSALLQQAVNTMRGTLGGLAEGVLGTLVQVPFLLAQLLVDVVVVLVIAFFWLTGVEGLRPFFVGLFPAQQRSNVQAVLDEIEHKTGGYLRGVAIDALVVGTLSGLADWLLGAPFPLILGVVAGATELIPYFGPWIGGGVAVALTLLSGQVFAALLIAVAYVVIQQVEGHVLVPYVMMRVVEVNPLTVVMATLLGFAVAGVVGGILAVPTASIIHVLVVRLVAPAIRSRADAWTRTVDALDDDGRDREYVVGRRVGQGAPGASHLVSQHKSQPPEQSPHATRLKRPS